MNTSQLSLRRIAASRRLVQPVVFALVVLAGCRAVDLANPALEPPPLAYPHEKMMFAHLAYRIEPPDMIRIEVLKIVPLPPYRAEAFDVLQIRATNTLLDYPVDSFFIVEAEGIINLGPAYGTVRVAGMTIDEIKQSVMGKLKETLRNPEVSVQLARVSNSQPITGDYLVGPDGTVNLRQYGMVRVAGKTVTEARVAIRNTLAQFLDSPEVTVDILAYNSKRYYVVIEGAGLGDNVRPLPMTGNETVLDAIGQLQGLPQISSKRIWIARPGPAGSCNPQILPVDWVAITKDGDVATNYQIMPGDRIFIAQDATITLTNFLGKIIGPFERVGGIVGLTGNDIRTYQTMGRNYNRTRSGF
jgi:polysaccharide biosynthesis/export protein